MRKCKSTISLWRIWLRLQWKIIPRTTFMTNPLHLYSLSRLTIIISFSVCPAPNSTAVIAKLYWSVDFPGEMANWLRVFICWQNCAFFWDCCMYTDISLHANCSVVQLKETLKTIQRAFSLIDTKAQTQKGELTPGYRTSLGSHLSFSWCLLSKQRLCWSQALSTSYKS